MQATSNIATSALLSIVEHAGTAVTILIEGLAQEELMRSRLTRPEVLRQLKSLADSLARIAPEVRRDMPELDWAGWDAMRDRLRRRSGEALDEALWFACESLVPATLLWLRVYRQSQPGLFLMRS
ncbi:hypothetical protein VAR608DRAFT_1270 [Variovorax sp. HW608]|uniref:hypothetical protein n=1 Tax=Variovorax sp. HW608 TaxID=1034889 RepID=UPI00081FAEBF|nr:hypothetical protein [Variovorax sp. HW608]SCK17964.1 hypothetical protein VAR608DRAFT_1270 [Variovorax sp. HW608]